MSRKVIGYIRVSTDKQDLDKQRHLLLEYAREHHLHIAEFVDIEISSRQSKSARRIDELFAKLKQGDLLLVAELSRLGRSTGEVIDLIDELIRGGVCIIVIKQNLTLDQDQDDIQSLTMIVLLSLFAEMERLMISKRTKEALAARKAQGVILGKPKGTIQNSVYDKDRERITELLQLGVSARHISTKHLGYGIPSCLSYYVSTRNLKTEAGAG
jgi:DNA invertase Pin-like site-specific DNA recombinase